jgi:cytochrome c5
MDSTALMLQSHPSPLRHVMKCYMSYDAVVIVVCCARRQRQAATARKLNAACDVRPALRTSAQYCGLRSTGTVLWVSSCGVVACHHAILLGCVQGASEADWQPNAAFDKPVYENQAFKKAETGGGFGAKLGGVFGINTLNKTPPNDG